MTVRFSSLLTLEGTLLARWGNGVDRRKSPLSRSWTSPKPNYSWLYVHYCQWPYQTNVSAIDLSASNFTVNASRKEAFVVQSVDAPIALTKREKKTRLQLLKQTLLKETLMLLWRNWPKTQTKCSIGKDAPAKDQAARKVTVSVSNSEYHAQTNASALVASIASLPKMVSMQLL